MLFIIIREKAQVEAIATVERKMAYLIRQKIHKEQLSHKFVSVQ
jgi:hypothetical protein